MIRNKYAGRFRPLVIVPTYNERANLALLVPKILVSLPNSAVLVVDDASPDGTARIAEGLARRHPGRIWVLKRPRKLGLGSAYVDGFRFALRGRFDPVIQMDADGSHDPAALADIRRALGRADVAVGSRYLGGLRIMNWPWTRLLLSVGANWYARLVTGVPIHDLTGGYNGLRRRILERLDLNRLKCNGYAFQIALKFNCRRLGARLVEVPVTFTGRMRGESKLSRAVFLEAVFAVWRLRFGAL